MYKEFSVLNKKTEDNTVKKIRVDRFEKKAQKYTNEKIFNIFSY